MICVRKGDVGVFECHAGAKKGGLFVRNGGLQEGERAEVIVGSAAMLVACDEGVWRLFPVLWRPGFLTHNCGVKKMVSIYLRWGCFVF